MAAGGLGRPVKSSLISSSVLGSMQTAFLTRGVNTSDFTCGRQLEKYTALKMSCCKSHLSSPSRPTGSDCHYPVLRSRRSIRTISALCRIFNNITWGLLWERVCICMNRNAISLQKGTKCEKPAPTQRPAEPNAKGTTNVPQNQTSNTHVIKHMETGLN
jgi:hypothetical protein